MSKYDTKGLEIFPAKYCREENVIEWRSFKILNGINCRIWLICFEIFSGKISQFAQNNFNFLPKIES